MAKSKWDKMEHYISSVVMRKQTISSMESEMDLYINKREELSKKIETYNKKLETALNRNQVRDEAYIRHLSWRRVSRAYVNYTCVISNLGSVNYYSFVFLYRLS